MILALCFLIGVIAGLRAMTTRRANEVSKPG